MDPDATVLRAAAALRTRLTEPPGTLITLGSGLGQVADAIVDPVDIPVLVVPGLPASTVPGHAGVLRAGRLGGRPVLAQLGRVHLYEGHTAREVTLVVEVAAALGASTFVVTSAAGAVDPTLRVGDLMVIEDQLNLTGLSPLSGPIADGAPAFVDMAEAYDRGLRDRTLAAGDRMDLPVRSGVYAGLRGPQYETPAEVRMLRAFGAQAVGMSTVLEVVAARARGMRVLGIAGITNVHHEASPGVTHDDVLSVAATISERMARLVGEVADLW